VNIFDYLQVVDGSCRLRPTGTMSIVDAVELVTRAIEYCRARRIRKLLVDVTGVSGLPAPTQVDRFLMVEDWANAAQGMVVVAMVAPPELIDPRRFGVGVALATGLSSQVFVTEAEAAAWLAAQA